MMPEEIKTLFLAFISKTGQSVAHNRDKIFSFGFSIRKRIYIGILYAEVQIPDYKGTQDKLNKDDSLHFFHKF